MNTKELYNIFESEKDSSWQIFHEPHINGSTACIICLSENHGLKLIELWNYGNKIFQITGHNGNTVITDDDYKVYSNPIKNLEAYAKKIPGLYMPRKQEKAEEDYPIELHVIFPTFNDDQIKQFQESTDNCKKVYIKMECHGGEEYHSIVKKILKTKKKKITLTVKQCDDIKNWLYKPSFISELNSKPPILSPQIRDIVKSKKFVKRRRIKGAAGTGKSFAIAGRAAELIKQGRDVLVVVFNHTLLPFLQRDCARFGVHPNSDSSYWINFHGLIKDIYSQINELNAYDNIWRDEDTSMQEKINVTMVKDLIGILKKSSDNFIDLKKYDAILIDEGQDYRKEWWDIFEYLIKDKKKYEYLIAADPTQNIYSRKLGFISKQDEQSGKSNDDNEIVGRNFRKWITLKQNYRSHSKLIKLEQEFIEAFLPDSDLPDIIKPELPSKQLELEGDCNIEYIYADESSYVEKCFEAMMHILKNNKFSFSDLTFLCMRKKDGIAVFNLMNSKEKNIRIIRTFKLEDELNSEETKFKKNFFLDSDKVKLSTIHSFKGAQSRALVTYIPKLRASSELEKVHTKLKEVYTCISRLKADFGGSHLIIVSSDIMMTKFLAKRYYIKRLSNL